MNYAFVGLESKKSSSHNTLRALTKGSVLESRISKTHVALFLTSDYPVRIRCACTSTPVACFRAFHTPDSHPHLLFTVRFSLYGRAPLSFSLSAYCICSGSIHLHKAERQLRSPILLSHFPSLHGTVHEFLTIYRRRLAVSLAGSPSNRTGDDRYLPASSMHISSSLMMTRLKIIQMHKQPMFFAFLILFLTGCQSGLSYRAVNLPADLAAPPTFNGQQFDLSRLGNTGAGSDLIQPKDTLHIVLSSGNDDDDALDAQIGVAENGTVDVPYIGPVHVMGMTESQATDAVRNSSVQRQIFLRPAVSVTFAKKHMHKVIVSGAVEKPGTYEIRASASNLATAILAAGGLTEKATSNIIVHSPGGNTSGGQGIGDASVLQAAHNSANASVEPSTGPKVIQVSLLSPETSRIASRQNLPDGTIITVKEQPARYVTVMGLTGNRSLEMPYDRELRLLDALAQAGGPRFSPWIANKLKVLRPHPTTGETVSIRVNLGEAKRKRDANIPLAPGDVLSVEETPLTFTVSTMSQLLGVGRSALTAGALP